MFGRPPTPTQGAVSFPGSPRVFICGTEWSVRPVVSLNQPAVLMCPRANRGRNHLHLCGREPISKEARGVLSPSATVGLLLPEREKPITPLWVLNALCWSGRTWRSLFHPRFPLFLFFSLFLRLQNSVAVASIHFPLAGPPLSSPALQSVDNSTCKLQFIVFRNGKLFPCTGNSSNLADDGKRRSVSTPVAFTKLGKRKFAFFLSLFLYFKSQWT